MPASRSTLFAMSPTARPTPCGAGLRTTSTDPLLPVTLNGSVWARPHPHSQEPQPRLISIMLSFALSIARRIDGPTSRPRARPRPAKPSLFPTMHVITKFTRRPESVIRCTILTSRTSSSVSGSRMSTISGSRIGRPVRIASPSVVSSPARTSRPSFVFGAHSLRFRSGRDPRAAAASGRLQLRLHGVELRRDRLPDVCAANSLLRWQHVRAVRDRDARVEQALQGGEETAAFRGPLQPQVEDRRRHALRGRPLAGQVSGQVCRWKVARARGPTALLQLERLRGRDDPVPAGVRDDELDDRLVERLPDHDARLAAPKELRPRPVVRAAFAPPSERDAVMGSLFHFGASLITPAARNCWSRWDFDLNMPPLD